MKKIKELLFGILISIIALNVPPIIVHYLWGSSFFDITNIPLFVLIVLVELVGAIYGGFLVGNYIKSNYLS